LLALRNGPSALPGALHDDHPEAVATTWSLSFARVAQASPLATELLQTCAFLAPDAIPEALLHEILKMPPPSAKKQEPGGQVSRFASRSRHQSQASTFPQETPLSVHEAVAILRTYSLVHWNPDGTSIRLHRLVQAVVRDSMSTQKANRRRERTIRLIDQMFPSGGAFEDWDACAQYLPHILVLFSHVKISGMTASKAADVFHRAGWYLGERGQYQEAEELLRSALFLQERGADHDDLAWARTALTLAWLYECEGKYQEAEPLALRAVSLRERLLGPDHPSTATSLNNLAGLYESQGRYSDAEPLYQRALALTERLLGPDHPDTATSLNNLAYLYQQQGRYSDAEPLLRQALSIREHVFGPEHPDTANSLWWLAVLATQCKRIQEAQLLYQRAISIYERTLGGAHPTTQRIQQLYTNLLKSLQQDDETSL
ncbi:MAG TPA: tetratricopeptide repeat protein, partial [Ktedonobacteraceae bacterium]